MLFRSQKLHDSPTIGHRLQLSRRAKVAEKAAAFLDRAQREDGGTQGALMLLFLPLSHGPVGFHIKSNAVITRYYINTLIRTMQMIRL